MHSPGPQSRKAFSLVEVSLALAIVGIAFTVIIAMLPVGLSQSRAATDTTNEARIFSAMSAILLATEYQKLPNLEKKIHYFDADGGFLEIKGSNDYKAERVYQAAYVMSPQKKTGSSTGVYDKDTVGRCAHVIFGRISAAATKIFDTVEAGDFDPTELKKTSAVKITPVMIAKMDTNTTL